MYLIMNLTLMVMNFPLISAFLKCGVNKYYSEGICKICPPYTTKLNFTIPDTQCDNITCTDGNSTWYPIDRLSSVPPGGCSP